MNVFVWLLFVLRRAAEADIDWRNVQGLNLVTSARSSTNPGKGCDASWAFAAATMLGDRVYIAAMKAALLLREGPLPTKATLSAQAFVNCASGGGCADGRVEDALEMATTFGAVDETCQSWRGDKSACDAKHVCVNCFGTCQAVDEYLVYGVETYGRATLDDASLRGGPVACRVENGDADDDDSVPTSKAFYASIVALHGDFAIGQPNFGTFRGNESDGFYSFPKANVRECWEATPTIPTKGKLGQATFLLQQNATTYEELESLLLLRESRRKRFQRQEEEEEEQGEEESPVVVSSSSSSLAPRKTTKKSLLLRGGGGGEEEDEEQIIKEEEPLPLSFDWRAEVPLTPVRSHHVGPIYCGGCYSFATTSTFSDRLKIERFRRRSVVQDVLVSAQAVVDCVNPRRGCMGGNAQDVFAFMESTALPDDTCSPFLSQNFHDCAAACTECPDYTDCTEVASFATYSAASHGLLPPGESAMMREIYHGGPIECMLDDSAPEFQDYDGTGVICPETNNTGHNHDVEVVGWGLDDETKLPYWIGRNSWGTAYGDGGFFRLCRGTNKLGIETEGCAYVTPNLQ